MDRVKIVPYILLAIIFILLIWIDIAWSNLSILQLKSIDEYAFHGSLLRMHEGVLNFELKKFFSFGFLSYGFIFFLTNLVVAFPFLVDSGSALSIILPRIMTSIFAIITLFYLLKIAQLQKATILQQIILLCLIVLMPGFWTNATWFHPDYMMAAFLCASIYYLSLDNNQCGKYFWIAILLWGFATATKIQAVTFAPVLLGMIIWKLNKRGIGLHTAFRLISISGIIVLVTFVILNPYIVHPLGAKAWWSAFQSNMLSNATNHGVIGDVTIWKKISQAIGNYYFSVPLFALMLLSAVYHIVKDWRANQLTANSLIAFYVLPNIIYLLFAVNKAWNHYYLAPLLMSTILIISAIKQPIRATYRPKALVISLAFFAIIIQSYSLGGNFVERIASRIDRKIVSADMLHRGKRVVHREDELLTLSRENTDFIKSYINKDTILAISPYTVFDYVSVGLKYDEVRVIYGPLREIYFNYSEKNKNPVNLIVLRKNDIYFKKERLSVRVDQAGYQHARQLIEKWQTGNGEFSLIAQNANLLIFKRQNSSRSCPRTCTAPMTTLTWKPPTSCRP